MKLKVYFSDGSTKIFSKNQEFMIIHHELEPLISTERCMPKRKGKVTLKKHRSYGIVPDFLEVLINSDFFFVMEEPTIYYNPNSICKFETLPE